MYLIIVDEKNIYKIEEVSVFLKTLADEGVITIVNIGLANNPIIYVHDKKRWDDVDRHDNPMTFSEWTKIDSVGNTDGDII